MNKNNNNNNNNTAKNDGSTNQSAHAPAADAHAPAINNINNNAFYCETCDFTCDKKAKFDKHLQTSKHLDLVKELHP